MCLETGCGNPVIGPELNYNAIGRGLNMRGKGVATELADPWPKSTGSIKDFHEVVVTCEVVFQSKF